MSPITLVQFASRGYRLYVFDFYKECGNLGIFPARMLPEEGWGCGRRGRAVVLGGAMKESVHVPFSNFLYLKGVTHGEI